MIIFGPRKITMSDISKNYEAFVQSFHFITEDRAVEAVLLSKNKSLKALGNSKYVVALILGLDDQRLLRRFFQDSEIEPLIADRYQDVYKKLTNQDEQSIKEAACLARQVLTDAYNSDR